MLAVHKLLGSFTENPRHCQNLILPECNCIGSWRRGGLGYDVIHVTSCAVIDWHCYPIEKDIEQTKHFMILFR